MDGSSRSHAKRAFSFDTPRLGRAFLDQAGDYAASNHPRYDRTVRSIRSNGRTIVDLSAQR
jgi:hypothetical protein